MKKIKLLSALLILSTLVFATALNRGEIPNYTSAGSVPSMSEPPTLETSSLSYTLIMDNITINGTIVLGNETRAIIMNSIIANSSYIRLKDNAYLEIRNSKFNDLTIETYNNSTLYIFDKSDQGLLIQGYDSSHVNILNDTYMATIFMYSGSLHIANATLNNTYINIQNTNAGFESVNFYYSTIEIRDHAQAEFSRCYSDQVHINVYNNSDLTVGGSNLASSTDIRLTFDSFLTIRSSNITYVYAYYTSFVEAYNSSIYSLFIYDSSYAYVDTVSISNLNVEIAYYGDYFEATADIINSEVVNAWILTAQPIQFSNTHVGYLSYARIYYGSFYINLTMLTYAEMENGAVLLDGSTAGTISVRSDVFVIKDASNVYINKTESYYIYNSSNINIESPTNTLVLSHSNATISATNADINLDAYNSSVDIVGSSGSFMYINSEASKINITNTQYQDAQMTLKEASSLYILGSEINGSYIYAPNAEDIQINNTVMYSTDYWGTPGSRVVLYNSQIHRSATGFLYLYDGQLIVIDSTIDLQISSIIHVESGTYNIDGGIITLPGTPIPEGIISGIIGIGTITVNNISINKVETVNAVVYFNSYTNDYSYIDFEINSTELHLNNVDLIDSSLETSESTIYLFDSSVDSVYSQDSLMIAMNNSFVAYISTGDLDLNANYSMIDEIYAETAVLKFLNSNVTKIDIDISCNLEGHNLWVFDGLNIGLDMVFTSGNSLVNILLDSGSNVSMINALGYGRIDILNSIVGQLLYSFADVYINSSTVQFTLRNYYITDSGSVDIDGNTISGSYEILLHPDAGSVIYQIGDGIVVNSTNPSLNLAVKNSEYSALLAYSGNITVINSKINIMIISTPRDITVMDSFSNLTMFGGGDPEEGPVIILSSPDVYVNNYTVLGSIGIINSSVEISDLNVTMGGLYSLGSQGNLQLIGNPIGVLFLDSGMVVTLSNSISADAQMENSLVSMNGGLLGRVQVVDSSFNYSNGDIMAIRIDNSTSVLNNIASTFNLSVHAESKVVLYQTNIDTISLEYSYDPESINVAGIEISATQTTISKALLGYKISGGSHVISDTPDLALTIYTLTESTITSYYEVRVDIRGTSITNITNLNEIPIRSIIAFVYRDYTKPVVTLLTPPLIEYEYGLHAEIRFVINEENPTYYELVLNFTTIVLTDTYTSDTTIVINLDTIITEPMTCVFLIKAYDAFGNMGTTNTTVIVHPAEPPEIMSAPEPTVETTLGEPVELTWHVEDESPAQYMIYVNGTLVNSSEWSGESVISFEFNASEPGTYNITIVFVDQLGQKTSNTTMVRVNPTTSGGGTGEEETGEETGGETGGEETGEETGGEETGEGGTTPAEFGSIISLVVVAMIILLIVAAIMMRKKS